MKKYKLINNLIGWLLIFPIATYTYIATIEPTASFWDCGEYIACSHKLEVGHPPGAPFFLLLGRLFILFGGDNVTTAARWVNIMSALASSFTILFLYWTITRLALKIVNIAKAEFNTSRMIAVLGSGVVGALAYAFSDSFWFSAVEGEVYAMSSLFTAVTFWAILKWEEEADHPSSVRWLILIAYIVGLSIGVHLLNLLVIPAICFIYYFRKYKFSMSGLILCSIVSVVLLGGIQGVLIPNAVKFSADFELYFVNNLGVSFNSGTVFYFVLLLGGIALGILYSIKKSSNLFNIFLVVSGFFALLAIIAGAKSGLNSGGSVFLRLIGFGGMLYGFYYLKKRPEILHHVLVSVLVLLLGYSTFFVLVIRSQANTPMDENNPENAISLLSYLNREQYGDWPILYGQYYNAKNPVEYKDGTPVYGRDTLQKKYVIIDDRKASIPVYDKAYCTYFPRMWSQQGGHANFYESWSGFNPDESDSPVPSFKQNLNYFFKYQVGYMYLRYFGWNFIGRQNDVQGLNNNCTEGNVISGIKAIDKKMNGVDPDKMPYALKNNKGTNTFYFLPLILGLIGLLFHAYAHPKDFIVCLLLFFFTGLAIVIYLNQYPYQPRERDYAYAASFYAFAIWIGLGVIGIIESMNKLIQQQNAKDQKGKTGISKIDKLALVEGNPYAFIVSEGGTSAANQSFSLGISALTFVLTLFVPYIMASQGWDDHDRSKRTMSRDFAINYLQSCDKNAVLFTNGDNDTFPLWYAQEVEGIRTDVRVINLSLLQTDWYINQMRRAAYDSPPVPFTMAPEKYEGSKREVVYIVPDKKFSGFQTAKRMIDFVASDDENDKIFNGDRYYDYLPTKKFRVPVYGFKKDSLQNVRDSLRIVNNKNLVQRGLEKRMVKNVDWETKKGYFTKNDLMILDLLAGFNWDRPVYFAVTAGFDSYLNLEDYFQLEGLAYRLVPIKAREDEKVYKVRVNSEKMYENIMNPDKAKWAWGGMDDTTGAGTNLDENCMRMAMNMRIQMTTLASALLREGKKEKALKVLDKMMLVMPEKNVPYDATLVTAVGCYYDIADKKGPDVSEATRKDALKKAITLSQKLFTIYETDYGVYGAIDTEFQGFYQSEINQAQDIMKRMYYYSMSYAKNETDTILKKELEKLQSNLKMRYENVFGAFSPMQESPQQSPVRINDSNC